MRKECPRRRSGGRSNQGTNQNIYRTQGFSGDINSEDFEVDDLDYQRKVHLGTPSSSDSDSNCGDDDDDSSNDLIYKKFRPAPYSYKELQSKGIFVNTPNGPAIDMSLTETNTDLIQCERILNPNYENTHGFNEQLSKHRKKCNALESSKILKNQDLLEQNTIDTESFDIYGFKEQFSKLTTLSHCGICYVTHPNQHNANVHYKSKKHKKRCNALKASKIFSHQDFQKNIIDTACSGTDDFKEQLVKLLTLDHCGICNVTHLNLYNADNHYKSKRHKKKCNAFKASKTFTNQELVQKIKIEAGCSDTHDFKEHSSKLITLDHCEICNVKLLNNHNADNHYKSKEHRNQEAIRKIKIASGCSDTHRFSDHFSKLMTLGYCEICNVAFLDDDDNSLDSWNIFTNENLCQQTIIDPGCSEWTEDAQPPWLTTFKDIFHTTGRILYSVTKASYYVLKGVSYGAYCLLQGLYHVFKGLFYSVRGLFYFLVGFYGKRGTSVILGSLAVVGVSYIYSRHPNLANQSKINNFENRTYLDYVNKIDNDIWTKFEW